MAYSDAQLYFINLLKNHLTMMGTKAAGSSYELPNKLGDDEIMLDIVSGLSFLNSFPPRLTFFRLQDFYNEVKAQIDGGGDPAATDLQSYESILIAPLIMCSLFFTGMRLQWFEAGMHFEYNDNGISLMRKKQMDYQNIVGGNILQYITTQLTMIKKVIGFSGVRIKGQFSGTVAFPRSLTRGLRGTRLGVG